MPKQILVGFLGLLCCWVLTPQPGWCGELKVMCFNIRFGTANDGPNHWDRRKEFCWIPSKPLVRTCWGPRKPLGFKWSF